jgi:hypothetical protein
MADGVCMCLVLCAWQVEISTGIPRYAAHPVLLPAARIGERTCCAHICP